MKRIILAALVGVLVFSWPPDAHAFSNDAFCVLVKEIANKTNAESPVWVDGITRQDGLAVFCSLKTVEFAKFIKVNPSDFRKGWQGRKQSQWNSIYCKGTFREAIDHGWHIILQATFVNGFRHRIYAKCE